MTGEDGAEANVAEGSEALGDDESPEQPWHNSTPAVLGASAAGLAAIALVYALVTFVARQFGGPDDTPADFVESTFSATATSQSATTTTETITSTSPPVTTDINPGETTVTSTETSETADSTTTRRTRARPGNDGDDEVTTTRRRPRFNETRTLYPQP